MHVVVAAVSWSFRAALAVTLALVFVAPPVAGAASITVNGSAGPVSVQPGELVVVSVSGGPGTPGDWVAKHAAGSALNTHFGDWSYLAGGQTFTQAQHPSSGTLSFLMPTAPGTYGFRFFASDGYTLLASSSPVQVGALDVIPPAPTPTPTPAATPTPTPQLIPIDVVIEDVDMFEPEPRTIHYRTVSAGFAANSTDAKRRAWIIAHSGVWAGNDFFPPERVVRVHVSFPR